MTNFYYFVSDDGFWQSLSEGPVQKFMSHLELKPRSEGYNPIQGSTKEDIRLIIVWCANHEKDEIPPTSDQIPADFLQSYDWTLLKIFEGGMANLIKTAKLMKLDALLHRIHYFVFHNLEYRGLSLRGSLVSHLAIETNDNQGGDSNTSDDEPAKKRARFEFDAHCVTNIHFRGMKPSDLKDIFSTFETSVLVRFARESFAHHQILTDLGFDFSLKAMSQSDWNTTSLMLLCAKLELERLTYCENYDEWKQRYRCGIRIDGSRFYHEMSYETDNKTFVMNTVVVGMHEESSFEQYEREKISIQTMKGNDEFYVARSENNCYCITDTPGEMLGKIMSFYPIPIRMLTISSVSEGAQFLPEAEVLKPRIRNRQLKNLYIGQQVDQFDVVKIFLDEIPFKGHIIIMAKRANNGFPEFRAVCDTLMIGFAHWMTVEHLLVLECKEAHICGTNLTNEDMAKYLRQFVSMSSAKLVDLKIGLGEERNWAKILFSLAEQDFKTMQILSDGATIELNDGRKLDLGLASASCSNKIQIKVTIPDTPPPQRPLINDYWA